MIVLASASFGVLGACLTLSGALLPVIVQELDIGLMGAGSLLALYPFGFLVSVLVAGRLIDGVGMVPVLAGGVAVAAVGFGGFGGAFHWLAGALMMFIAGLGFGAMEVAANSALITIGGARSANVLNLAHLFFGVGSFIAPVVATRTVAAGVSWRLTFLVAGIMTLAISLGWSRVRLTRPIAPDPGSSPVGAERKPVIVMLAILLALYVGTEMGIGNWVTKYMVSERGVSLTDAGNALSAYWFGLASGRLLLSLLPRRGGEEALLVVLTAVATVSLVIALRVSHPVAATVALAVTGLGLSGIFPGVVALGGRHHREDVAAATSLIIGGAGVGGIVIPWVMSAIAAGAGLATGMGFYAGMCVLMTILALSILRYR